MPVESDNKVEYTVKQLSPGKGKLKFKGGREVEVGDKISAKRKLEFVPARESITEKEREDRTRDRERERHEE